MTELQQQYSQIAELEDNNQPTAKQGDSFSFIVRVWKESSHTADDNPAGWRGSIERVGLNQRMYVHQLDSILAFIEEQTGMQVKQPHPIKAVWRALRRYWSSIRYGHR